MPASPPVNWLPVAFALYFVWRVFRRVRRSIGRQPLRTNRMMVRIGFYLLLTIFLGAIVFLFGNLTVMAALAGGLVAGAGLGVYGVFMTQFEATPEGRFYTPNRYIGVGVSALLVARLAYRLFALSNMTGQAAAGQPQLLKSPLTLFLFGLLAGYYISYFSGLLIKGRA